LNHAGDTTYETQSYKNSIMTLTVNVKFYQNTKMVTQRQITDDKLGGGWKYKQTSKWKQDISDTAM